MSGVGFDNNVKRQGELYRRSIEDNRRNHKEEIENLKKSHDHTIKKQSESHSKQLGKVEKDHIEVNDRVRVGQKRALVEKSEQYDKELARNKNEFHDLSRENIQNWNKNTKS